MPQIIDKSFSDKSYYIWNIYINNILENLSLCCNENRIIHKDDIVELSYEKF